MNPRALGLGATLAVGVAIAHPREAHASPCCGDASALGQRLAANELAAFATLIEGSMRYGSYGGDGVARALSRGILEGSLGVDASATVRAHRWVELGARVPLRLQAKSLDGEQRSALGAGDVLAFARLQLVSPTLPTLAPGVFVSVATVLPTGAPRAAADLVGVTALGQGAAEGRLTVSLEKAWRGLAFARVGATVGVFAPHREAGVALQRSPRVVVSALAGPVLGSAALGVGLEHEREEPPSGGAARAGRARTSMLLSCAVSDLAGREGPGLALLLGLRAELPIDGLGSNEPTGMAASVGLRYAMEGFAR